jgi:hypothetical protein
MIFQPLVSYNGGILVAFTLPMKLWTYEEGAGMGGEDTTASGIPSSYVVRWDQATKWSLRFTDAERTAVMEWLKFSVMHKNMPFDVYFDQAVLSSRYTVYLESPKAAERIQATREDATPWVWTTDVTFRSVNSTRFSMAVR